MSHLFRTIAPFVLASSIGASALAQSAHYTSMEAISGKPMQLTYYASVRKDCTPAPLPTIRVVQPPKSGVLTIRPAVLTTNKIAGCPGLKVPAQVLFYQARAGYAGSDHISYEVTTSPGGVGIYDVTINVKAAPSPNESGGGTGAPI